MIKYLLIILLFIGCDIFRTDHISQPATPKPQDTIWLNRDTSGRHTGWPAVDLSDTNFIINQKDSLIIICGGIRKYHSATSKAVIYHSHDLGTTFCKSEDSLYSFCCGGDINGGVKRKMKIKPKTWQR